MKQTLLTLMLSAAVVLASCSEKASSETSENSSANEQNASSGTPSSSLSEESVSADTDDLISLVRTDENTVESSDGRLRCEYEFKKTDNGIYVTVNYTNLTDEYMIANFMPRVYVDDTELYEKHHGDDFSDMTELGGGDVYSDMFEYEFTDGSEAYLVLQVLSEDAYSDPAANGTAADAQELAEPKNYTSDSDDNNKEDFTISLKQE